jgi:hypothetical protein
VTDLAALLEALRDAALRAALFAFEGTSTPQGRHPDWAHRAADLVVTDLDAGSTVVRVEAPVFEAVAAREMHDRAGWPLLPAPHDTALTALGRSVRDTVADARPVRPHFDAALLDHLRALVRALRGEGDAGSTHALTVRQDGDALFTLDGGSSVYALQCQTPDPRVFVTEGRLHAISEKRRLFTLHAGEVALPARAQGKALGERALGDLDGTRVLVEGRMHFAPGGHVRFIEARTLRPFDPDRAADRHLAKTPAEMRDAVRPPQLPHHQGPTDVHARMAGRTIRKVEAPRGHDAEAEEPDADLPDLWGAWPGDESIEEILAMLD